MSKNDILQLIATDKSFKEMVYKQNYQKDLLDDLFQESFIIMAEKTEKFLQDLFESEFLLRYWNGLIYKSINSTTSPFYKKFRHTENNISLSYNFDSDASSDDDFDYDYNNILIEEEDPEIESDETKESLLQQFENLYWYDREIMKLYQIMRIEDIVKQVGISRHAVNMSLKRTRESLREKAKLNKKKNIW